MKSWVDIRVAGRATERHRLHGQTVIGTSSDAGVRLREVQGILPEHFSLTPQPEGCWLELSDTATDPFVLNGAPHRATLVPWDGEVFYGSIRLAFRADRESAGKTKTSPVLLIAVALAIPLAGLSFFGTNRHSSGVKAAERTIPPALFAGETPCTESAEGALMRARVAERAARAKNERGVFELRDAVDAVHIMGEAAQCYLLASRHSEAERVNELSKRWVDKLDFRFQRTLLQFELARRDADGAAIQRHVRELSTLLTHAGPSAEAYKSWLDLERRDVRARQAEKAAEGKKK